MNTKHTTIDEYISSLPDDVGVILEKVRTLIKKLAPDATETISYQIPTFKLNGKPLVHFAGWKSHIGFYPTSSGTKQFKKEISKYESGKGSIKFPLDKPIPYDLIEKIVRFRMKEVKTED